MEFQDFRVSKSSESIEPGENHEAYIEQVSLDFEEEIHEILKTERFLGSGNAALVHSMEGRRSGKGKCVKIWRPELKRVLTEDVYAYRKIQPIDPIEEFELQDSIYESGFRKIPRAIMYSSVGDYNFMLMEEIKGYDLSKIMEAGAIIANPAWSQLRDIMIELNNKYGVVHRDLKAANIMLKTEDPLERGAELNGEIIIIDFGKSKRIPFSSPEPSDFNLTIAGKVIPFAVDSNMVELLKPTGRGISPFARRS